jgi:hypothetical protein
MVLADFADRPVGAIKSSSQIDQNRAIAWLGRENATMRATMVQSAGRR